MLAPVLESLKEREKRILRLRFVEGMSQREIAHQVGLSEMQISRLLTQILEHRRNGIGELPSR